MLGAQKRRHQLPRWRSSGVETRLWRLEFVQFENKNIFAQGLYRTLADVDFPARVQSVLFAVVPFPWVAMGKSRTRYNYIFRHISLFVSIPWSDISENT